MSYNMVSSKVMRRDLYEEFLRRWYKLSFQYGYEWAYYKGCSLFKSEVNLTSQFKSDLNSQFKLEVNLNSQIKLSLSLGTAGSLILYDTAEHFC